MDLLGALGVLVRVVETGSHSALMIRNGLYARLAKLQFEVT